jgi:murein L,D-transpeptidase YafK
MPTCRFVKVVLLSLATLGSSCTPVEPTSVSQSLPAQIKEEQRSDPWVLIDSKNETVTVLSKSAPPVVFENAAFGAAGVKNKVKRGDDVTPLGKFLVTHISHASKYTIFIGMNYPRPEDALRGLRAGIITQATYNSIVKAHEAGRTPPQNTNLGGLIGIHGTGRGSPEIHAVANWTAGCVALTNSQIRQLARLVKVGTHIEIR